MQTDTLFTEADIISIYTRAQAIEDGQQVKLEGEQAAMARRLYKYPVYLTTGVWGLVEKAIANKRHCNDLNGVLWDILWMSTRYRSEGDATWFQVTITGTGRKRLFTMIAKVGPTDHDDPSPAITIMLPKER